MGFHATLNALVEFGLLEFFQFIAELKFAHLENVFF